MPVQLRANERQLAALAQQLKGEADGAQLKKDMVKEIRDAVKPAVADVKTAIRALSGVPTEVRRAVASKTQVAVRTTNDARAGVRVYVNKNAAPDFLNAAQDFNDAGGWRARNPRGGGWHPQRSSNPGFWDHALEAQADACKAAVLAAVDAMAQRIAGRATP